LSAPLALDSTTGDRHFAAQNYTRLRRSPQFEIFILPIDFSDDRFKIILRLMP
jgi:hypothetical protein